MMQPSSKMMTHHSVMTSSLRIKIEKMTKSCDFSSDIDYNSKTDVFRDVIYLQLINVSLGFRRMPLADIKVSASRAAQASKARLYLFINKYITINRVLIVRVSDTHFFKIRYCCAVI